jgi:hypothetical protein
MEIKDPKFQTRFDFKWTLEYGKSVYLWMTWTYIFQNQSISSESKMFKCTIFQTHQNQNFQPIFGDVTKTSFLRSIEMRFSKKFFYKFFKMLDLVIYFWNFEKIFIFEPTGTKIVLFSLIFWSANLLHLLKIFFLILMIFSLDFSFGLKF